MLTGSKIKELLNKDIIIKPFIEANLNPNSYDVTLGNSVAVYLETVLDPKKVNRTKELKIPEQGMVLVPGELYIAHTNEYTETYNLVPTLQGKSSLARLGLSIHVTAGLGDVGFKGQWVLEITVTRPVKVYPNMKIGQLVYFETVGNTSMQYKGKYVDQKGNVCSESFKDFK